MSTLKELIDLHCPDGVVQVRLGDIAERQRGTSITATQMKEWDTPSGDVLVFAAGSTCAMVPLEAIPSKAVHSNPSVVVKARGYVDFTYCDRPFSTKSELWSYGVGSDSVNIRFLYHYLREHVSEFQDVARLNGVKLPQLKVTDTDNYLLPLPPREVQDKIVEILDTFSALCDNLDMEIAQREQQFDEYRHQLLDFSDGDSVVRVRLGDIAKSNKGGGTPNRKQPSFWGGDIPWASVGDLSTPGYALSSCRNQITEDGLRNSSSNLIDPGALIVATRITPGLAKISDAPVAINQDLRGLVLAKEANTKFVYYAFRSLEIETRGSIVKSITNPQLESLEIPFPPLDVQQDIANKLDVMQDLIGNLKLEREQRGQQFEYYRAQLLTFPAKDVSFDD